MKKIVLSDRGCLFVDNILEKTDWEITLLIVDDFGHHKEKYVGNDRIKKITTFSEIINWNGECDLDKEEVMKYLHLFNIGDYGSRRIRDDYHFSHYQFYIGIAFWKWFFNNNKVDMCVITNTIHGFANDYLLEAYCMQMNMPCYNIFYHFIDKFGVFDAIKQELAPVNNAVKGNIDIEKIAQYRSSFNYEELGDIPYKKIAKVVYKIWGAKGIRYCAFLLRGKQSIHYRECTLKDYRGAIKAIKSTKKEVSRLYTEPDYEKNYLVSFLHFEPEAVLTGNAQIIDSQLMHIRMLADKLPEGWVLYVKEHPDLYQKINSWRLEYHIPVVPTFYTEYFYKALTTIPNVQLVHYKTPASEMIKHSKGIATVAGTVMSEAICMNKPIFMFADKRHVYCLNKDVFHIQSSNDIANAIGKVQEGFVPNYDNISELCDTYLAGSDDNGKNAIIKYLSEQK